ncbi:hypothetical protein [Pseudomonas sp. PDM13]|uniref:hypothetical protein n=1 Tax=Pseudomonas sp. PDM13 TaxID=2769255 RepID=UPI0021E04D0B|nr:hypothetical protein [Pseudomonas sp. PDM13]MCU9949876.1 hypothetical protein [Pseudomonas sp. PDM13]
MLSYQGQAIVSFTGRAGSLIGIQSRRTDISVNEVADGNYQLETQLDLRDTQEVRLTLSSGLILIGTAVPAAKGGYILRARSINRNSAQRA